MKINILVGFVIAGTMATSAAQAATYPSIESAEALYSGLSVAHVQLIHRISEQKKIAHKATCNWRQEAEAMVDQLHAPYPGSEGNFVEKDYLATANFNFRC